MNEMGEKSKPDIRFAGFTEAWEQHELGDVAEFNPKSTLPDSFEYVDLESVVGTDLISHRTELRPTAPSRAQRLARRGDIFYQTVRPYQKNNYLFDFPCNDYVFSTGYAQMRPSIDSRFLFSRLQEELFVKAVLDRCTGTSYPAINANDLSEIEVKVPCDKAEQIKIGATFKSLDHLITLHQREHDKTVNIKKAMLEKMFPKEGEDKPEIRFAGFSDVWEQRKLSSMADVTDTMHATAPLEDNKTQFRMIRTSSVRNGNLYSEKTDSVDEKTYTKWSDRIRLQKGDVVFSREAPIGESAVIPEDEYKYFLGQRMVGIRSKENLSPEFLNVTFLAPKFRNEVAIRNAESTTVANFGIPSIKSYELDVPSLQEQRQIGSLFTALDHLITLHQRELSKLQNMKKALLGKMFV